MTIAERIEDFRQRARAAQEAFRSAPATHKQPVEHDDERRRAELKARIERPWAEARKELLRPADALRDAVRQKQAQRDAALRQPEAEKPAARNGANRGAFQERLPEMEV